MANRANDKDRSKDHRWEQISSNQHRCKYCQCMKTRKYANRIVAITYQKSNGELTDSYLECIGKPDLSEFY